MKKYSFHAPERSLRTIKIAIKDAQEWAQAGRLIQPYLPPIYGDKPETDKRRIKRATRLWNSHPYHAGANCRYYEELSSNTVFDLEGDNEPFKVDVRPYFKRGF